MDRLTSSQQDGASSASPPSTPVSHRTLSSNVTKLRFMRAHEDQERRHEIRRLEEVHRAEMQWFVPGWERADEMYAAQIAAKGEQKQTHAVYKLIAKEREISPENDQGAHTPAVRRFGTAPSPSTSNPNALPSITVHGRRSYGGKNPALETTMQQLTRTLSSMKSKQDDQDFARQWQNTVKGSPNRNTVQQRNQ